MGTRLRCLLVEDSASDAGLVVRLLEKAGYEVIHERVETVGQMRAALENQAWDAIIADYNLPEFSAPAALEVLQQRGLDLPFLVVSNCIGEDAAVAMMRAGAHDYLMKDNLARLGPALERELGDAEMRRQRRRGEKELGESEKRFRSVVENAPEGLFVAVEGRFRYLNPAAVEVVWGRLGG